MYVHIIYIYIDTEKSDTINCYNMANDTSVLIMLVIFMLIGSYTAGSIPLIMKLSEVKDFYKQSLYPNHNEFFLFTVYRFRPS